MKDRYRDIRFHAGTFLARLLSIYIGSPQRLQYHGCRQRIISIIYIDR